MEFGLLLPSHNSAVQLGHARFGVVLVFKLHPPLDKSLSLVGIRVLAMVRLRLFVTDDETAVDFSVLA